MLEIIDIQANYGGFTALSGVSIEVRPHKVVGVVGANGSGKTTLLHVIAGLLKPTMGIVRFNGERIDTQDAFNIVDSALSLVPEGRRLFPFMTVRENLQVGSTILRARKRRAETMVRMLEFFPVLAQRQNQLAGTLSGGEQQMLAVARALMSCPTLIMLDEPSLGLAPMVAREIYNRILTLSKQEMTILLVEQNVTECLNLAHRAYVLENGRVILSGAGQELLGTEHVRRAYLGL
ncbi:MAG: ABC transporter ATP-binding protein [Deltaproteobacteria bacterium]|nr:ABC transporter ATP-binding protein [Deltaproteobacteria bacterium]